VARATCCPGARSAQEAIVSRGHVGQPGAPSDGHRPPLQLNHSAHAAPASESLPRSRIIRRRGVFDTARNKGRRVSSRHFILNFIAREALTSGETGSVAFLTPKRLGPATVRNKLRRRMREIYRRELARPDETAYLIWIARPPAVELSFEDLKQAMRDLAKRSSR
jgi:ribonuclease P protein component